MVRAGWKGFIPTKQKNPTKKYVECPKYYVEVPNIFCSGHVGKSGQNGKKLAYKNLFGLSDYAF